MGLIVAIPIHGDRHKNNRITLVEGDAKRDAIIVISGLVWFSKIVSSTVSPEEQLCSDVHHTSPATLICHVKKT